MSIELALIDSSRRSYPEVLTLLRQWASGGLDVVNSDTIDAIFDWLLVSAIRERDPLVLFDTLCWRIAATEVPLDQMSLHVGTLHPQIRGLGWGGGGALTDCATSSRSISQLWR